MNREPDIHTTDTALEKAFQERLTPPSGETERVAWLKLARRLGRLPSEHGRVTLELSAALSSIAWRLSREFLRVAPEAAQVLSADDLRQWGDIGRRLALGDVDTAANFFAAGADDFAIIPPEARPALWQACSQQLTLSGATALATLQTAPQLARTVPDADFLRSVFQTVTEIARRSAKHSADFLAATPAVIQRGRIYPLADRPSVMTQAAQLAHAFAIRAGGLATDFWVALPAALARQTALESMLLLRCTEEFLQRGGGAALHFFTAGGVVLRSVPEVFADWSELLRFIADYGNAALVAYVRSSPPVFQAFAQMGGREKVMATALRVLTVVQEIARTDYEAALACLRASPAALRGVTLEQFEQWARDGLRLHQRDGKARRSYYALETRRSHEALRQGEPDGLRLEAVRHTLQLYIEGLTGRVVELAALETVPAESRINDGKKVYLPAQVTEFNDESADFRLYKVLAAHAAGQIEFGTHDQDTPALQAAFAALAELYAPERQDDRDAFAAGGYILDKSKSEKALPADELARQQARERKKLPVNGDYHAVLRLFPDATLGQKIFGTLENGRIDRRLRHIYRGLARDLDWSSARLRASRPRLWDLPPDVVPFELLFQITLCGGATDDARNSYGQIVSELETVIAEYLSPKNASVADTLLAASRIYTLFTSLTPQDDAETPDTAPQDDAQPDTRPENQSDKRPRPQPNEPRPADKVDARELFNAWSQPEMDAEPDDLEGNERWMHAETPEQPLGAGEIAYSYDEWDRELSDHRAGWCRVIEKQVKAGDASFVAQTRERYRGLVSSLRQQFQMLKPENLRRIHNELDGDDYDLNAVIDYVIDRRAAHEMGGHLSERLYIKRLRRQRDVAVSFLLDQSSSTARTIGRNPLQPYTYPGRRIIEIAKEGLVLMSEALEAVGDLYAINGFTSEGRRNVKFYVIKDFQERYSETVHQRIGGVTYQNNTRLGAAVRHAAARLAAQEARTRLLIVLSDGRPYDHDYGDARYAREDTREALRQAKINGITPFCITIDKDSEAELRDLYGEVGYTIIDDVLSLPERMPGIYRRLTS